MKLSHTIVFAIFGLNLTAFAQAEVVQPQEKKIAEPKNDLTEHFQVAQPKPKAQPAAEPAEKSGTVSMTKEELAQHPDLIVRGLIPAVLQNKRSNYYCRCTKTCQSKILSCVSGQKRFLLKHKAILALL